MQFQVGSIKREQMDLFFGFLTEQAVHAYKAKKNTAIIGLATSDRTACGALAGHMEDTDLFAVDSFYVHPKVRRHGGGTMLWEALLDELGGDVAVRISFAETSDDTEALYEFLIARGYAESSYDPDDESPVHRFTIVE